MLQKKLLLWDPSGMARVQKLMGISSALFNVQRIWTGCYERIYLVLRAAQLNRLYNGMHK